MDISLLNFLVIFQDYDLIRELFKSNCFLICCLFNFGFTTCCYSWCLEPHTWPWSCLYSWKYKSMIKIRIESFITHNTVDLSSWNPSGVIKFHWHVKLTCFFQYVCSATSSRSMYSVSQNKVYPNEEKYYSKILLIISELFFHLRT